MAEIVQVVTGEGVYLTEEMTAYADRVELAECKTNYQVVAIMGPQSSGKSTLLNHVFGTDFQMMDAMSGRGQTTKGIWLSKSPKVSEIATLVMDLEGSDGRERGEDDTNFERQSALFALSVADILLVNVWCHDIGREHGSGKPLLKTIFQVNLKLFAPDPSRKRTVLLFVIRDKTKTPLPKLVEVLEADLTRMWENIAKPKQYTDSKLQDFFEVQYAGLSHFEERYDDFVADTNMLRRRFDPESEDTLCRGYEKLPGDSFVLSTKGIWEVIRSQKDLNLPAHKIMVANTRCQQILDEQLAAFTRDQAWERLKPQEGVIVAQFSTDVTHLMDSCLAGYDAEARYFDAGVQAAKRSELLRAMLAEVAPLQQAQAAAHQALVVREELQSAVALQVLREAGKRGEFAVAAVDMRAAAVARYEQALREHVLLPEGVGSDGSAELAGFTEAVDALLGQVRGDMVAALLAAADKQLAGLISGPVISLLDTCQPGVWQRLHGVAAEALRAASGRLHKFLEGYGLSAEQQQALDAKLHASATSRLDNHLREAALTRLSRMKDRFQHAFTLDDSQTPRVWGPRDDIPALAAKARMAAARVLSTLTYIRPAGLNTEDDVVEAAVLSLASSSSGASAQEAAVEGEDDTPGGADDGAGAGTSAGGIDIASAAEWPDSVIGQQQQPEEAMLLTPQDVRTTWREFVSTSNVIVQQALATQQANKMANNRAPPLWAIAAMVVLGWNELMSLLFSPLYLVLGLLSFLFLRSLYTELDVDKELQRGALPGGLVLANKFWPACKKVVASTKESILAMMNDDSPGEVSTSTASSGRAGAYGLQESTGSSSARAPNTSSNITQRASARGPGDVEFTDLRSAAAPNGAGESRKDR